MDRACRRVLQVLEHAGRTEPDLLVGVRACRDTVWRSCAEAVARDPGASRDVPSDDGLATAHRAVARAATSMAQAAQALVIAPDDLTAATRAVAAATARADEAAVALGLAPGPGGDP